MKRFLTSIVFCAALLAVGFFLFSEGSSAEGNLPEKLLKLAAPPPPNPFFKQPRLYRDEAFYDPMKPPGDDASTEDLLDYWSRQNVPGPNGRGFSTKPSEKTLERLMEQISEDPEKLTSYLSLFEENKDGIDFIKRLYDSELLNRKLGKEWREAVKAWLTYNSSYFSSELLAVARNVRDQEEYVTNQDELLALAKVDWNTAEPLLNRLENNGSQPISQTLARWAYYQHAIDNKDTLEADKWRDLLKKTVEDKSAMPGNRDLAMDALVRGGDFEGRDEWYMSLLEDETLHDLRVNGRTYTGLTTIINFSPPGKYNDRMIDLIRTGNKAVRSAAIRNLTNNGGVKSEEAARAMLPWLEDPDWATDVGNSRRSLINAFKEYKVPEAVPGLVAMLEGRESIKAKLRRVVTSNANYPRPVGNVAVDSPTSEIPNIWEYQGYVLDITVALGKQGDPRAVPAMRQAIPEVATWQLPQMVKAIIDCNGYSVAEQIEGIEHVARNSAQIEELDKATNSAAAAVNAPRMIVDDPKNMVAIIGNALYSNDNPRQDLVEALMNRIEYLQKREPAVAANMRNVLRGWNGIAVNAVLMRSIKNGDAEISDVLKILARRRLIKQEQINDIFDMRGGGPFAVGISACMLEQNAEYDAILSNDNADMKIAMLGCARLIRAPLPVSNVADLLRSDNKLLVTAAERYLESEDSAEARSLVLARHPNEAKVLGARGAFEGEVPSDDTMRELFVSVGELESTSGYDMEFGDLDEIEDKLREELKTNQELLGVYAFDKNFVRIYRDRAVFSWEEDPARFRERTLQTDEFDRLKAYLAEARVDELPPFLTFCGEYCGDARELLMMSRAGGRRVFQLGYELPPFFKKLNDIFLDYRKAPAKLNYYMQSRIPGLAVLFEDESLAALAVWKSGPDLRVLIDNTDRRKQIDAELKAQDDADSENENLEYEEIEERRRKRHAARAFENLAWFRFGNNRPIAPTEQPADFSFVPQRDRLAAPPDQYQWKARIPTLELRGGGDALFKLSRGALTKFKIGNYESPIIAPSGRWAIARKYGDEDNPYGQQIVRINLLTGKEFPVKFERYPPLQPIVWVSAQNKFLVGSGYNFNEYDEYQPNTLSISTPEYQQLFWLDADTGELVETKGDVRPLAQQTFRPLQPVTGKPDEFWAAIPNDEKNETVVGTYSTRSLIFRPVLTLPLIQFDSISTWIDEAENKIYVAYSGHLLTFPLRAVPK